MKTFRNFLLLTISFTLLSCKTMVYNKNQGEINNTLITLNEKYQIKTKDNKVHKLKIVKIDEKVINGINNKGETELLQKEEVRDIKKVKVISTILIAVAAITAVIFVPI